MRYIVKPGIRYPDWELYRVVEAHGHILEDYVCAIQAANAADARESAKRVIEWWTQPSVEFEV